MDMRLILNGYHDAAVCTNLTPLDFYLWGLHVERSLQKKGGYTRRIARSHFGCCCQHKETWRWTQTNNTRSHTSYKV